MDHLIGKGKVVLLSGVMSTALLVSGTTAAQERQAYFGQTHQHTSWSVDAYLMGNKTTGPAESYEYAMGKTIKHPAGFDIKIKTPLDFQGVTDHAEYLNVMTLVNDPESALYDLPISETLRPSKDNPMVKVFQRVAAMIADNDKPVEEFMQPEIVESVWQENIDINERYNKPGEFTTFCAYEWTAMPQHQNMHRNIFFKDCQGIPSQPFTALHSDHPEDLWHWMDEQRKNGTDLLAISHNANLSNGLMFPIELDSKGKPIDAAWAQDRLRNEPLTEIKQNKGTSETTPALSPNDEFAGFELMNYLIGLDDSFSNPNGSYIRQAFQNGLAMQDSRGYNPYKMGVVGGGDSHNTAISYSQSNHFGNHGAMDATPEVRLSGAVDSGMTIIETGTSGLGGVWAEENTRESIYDAMQRREVFATSGVRLKLRMFGGWEYSKKILSHSDWDKKAYKTGVPMGGELSGANGRAPSFIVWALKDPADGNLDRIQIVKGWTKNGQIFEKIFDVAWSGKRKPDSVTGKLPPVGNTVDIMDASYTNDIGAVELKAVWTDPEFEPSQNAFYYARALQIPTPRWSTYDASKLGVVPPGNVPATIQERAWGTPIWYSPDEKDASKAKTGLTVADLRKAGAKPLNNEELEKLVVGKNLAIRNTVTGETSSLLFGEAGVRFNTRLNSDGNGVTSDAADYEIKDDRVVTTVDQISYELAVYKIDGKYLAARSNEFGHVNYELQASSD